MSADPHFTRSLHPLIGKYAVRVAALVRDVFVCVNCRVSTSGPLSCTLLPTLRILHVPFDNL